MRRNSFVLNRLTVLVLIVLTAFTCTSCTTIDERVWVDSADMIAVWNDFGGEYEYEVYVDGTLYATTRLEYIDLTGEFTDATVTVRACREDGIRKCTDQSFEEHLTTFVPLEENTVYLDVASEGGAFIVVEAQTEKLVVVGLKDHSYFGDIEIRSRSKPLWIVLDDVWISGFDDSGVAPIHFKAGESSSSYVIIESIGDSNQIVGNWHYVAAQTGIEALKLGVVLLRGTADIEFRGTPGAVGSWPGPQLDQIDASRGGTGYDGGNALSCKTFIMRMDRYANATFGYGAGGAGGAGGWGVPIIGHPGAEGESGQNGLPIGSSSGSYFISGFYHEYLNTES